MSSPLDPCALGAALLPTRDLLRMILPPRVRDDDLDAAVAAWSLTGAAQHEALLALRHGPALLAARELGRRAWMHPQQGRRINTPHDVADVVRPRATEREAWFTLALDARLSLARCEESQALTAAALRVPLAAGCTRVVLAVRRFRAAVPTSGDIDDVALFASAAALVGVDVIDGVIVGDDGFTSLVHLGLRDSADRRWT